MLLRAPRCWALALVGAAGLLAGTGLLMLHVSKAVTYIKSDSWVCANCHVMYPQYATWNHSSHRERTNCSDCHLPHDNLVHYLVAKGQDGLRDSYLYLTRSERNRFDAGEHTRKMIQENCLRCHSELVDPLAWGKMSSMVGQGGQDRLCWDCHREVPHGRIKGLTTTPEAEIQLRSRPLPEWLRRQLEDSSKRSEP
jgi:cytochrome c nitrite reductase small subunit